MIIIEKIKIKVSKLNIKHLLSRGYDVKLKDMILVNSDDLCHGSHIKIKVKCDTCGKEKELSFQKYIKNIKNDNFYACSSKCAQEKVKKTSIKKFGKEYYMKTEEYLERVNMTDIEKYGCHHTKNEKVIEKQKETLLKKYGVDNYFKSNEFKENNKNRLEKMGVVNNFQLEDVKTKSKETCIKKYGVQYSCQSNIVKDKIGITNLKKYGFISASSNDIIKEKIFKTNIDKFGVKCVLILPENKEKSKISRQKNYYNYIKNKYTEIQFLNYNTKQKEIKIQCNRNHIYEISRHVFYSRINSNTELCTICNNIERHSSGLESQLYYFIKENYSGEIITNTKKIISPLELDIYLPELKLAFEFNGIYWHNEINKEINYHLNKTEDCEKQGIQLIHIWEDDWINKQKIIKSMILNKLEKTINTIISDEYEVKEISDNKLVREFLNINHIQGFIKSNIKLGLFYNNELVSLMIFQNKNMNKYELLRFCNKLNTNIIDSENKLLNYFINNYNSKEITIFVDRSFSNCELYINLGFKFEEKTKSDYYYIIDGIKNNKFNFRKNKLVEQGYDKNKTEHEIMLERKIFRIYYSGNLKYKYII